MCAHTHSPPVEIAGASPGPWITMAHRLPCTGLRLRFLQPLPLPDLCTCWHSMCPLVLGIRHLRCECKTIPEENVLPEQLNCESCSSEEEKKQYFPVFEELGPLL